MRECGGVVSARIAMVAAKGILLKCNRTMLSDYGGHVNINRQWLHSLLKRMKLFKPMNVSVNKPAKDFIKRQFIQWYSEQVLAQIEGQDVSDLESFDCLASLKEVEVKWLVDMADYSSDNSQMIVNGFIHSGIAVALDGKGTDIVEIAEFCGELCSRFNLYRCCV